MKQNNHTPKIESVQTRDTDAQQHHEAGQNHIGTKEPIIKAYPLPNQGVGKENGLQHFPKAFLPPFRHGFHREIVESPTGHRITHYIHKGERITNEENLGPHIKDLKDITERNFTFQPIMLPIRDPLNKYQSIRRVKPNQRQGPYRPAFGEIKSDNERLPHKTPWQIETAIRRGEHISEEEKRK